MAIEAQKAKILAAINARGWCALGVFDAGAKALSAEGLIKWGERFSVGGNRTIVWVAA